MRMMRIEEIEGVLLSALTEAKEQIQANLQSTRTNASGKTSASLCVEVDGNGGELLGRQAFGTVEKGRKPGKVPPGFREIIYQWMQDKGVHATIKGRRSQHSADLSMAYLIARRIRLDGSKLYRDGGRSDIYSNVLPFTIERVKSELTDKYRVVIKSILK